MDIIYEEPNIKNEKIIKEINNICFNDVPTEDVIYDFIDSPVGNYFIFENNKVVGKVGIHLRKANYNGYDYILGGLGGLAVLPEYRNKGYGSKLIECAINKLTELKCDMACMCVDRSKNVYKLYEKYGYVFLNRNAYFMDALNRKKTDDSVMILGICNQKLANHILSTNFEFNYGNEKGYW